MTRRLSYQAKGATEHKHAINAHQIIAVSLYSDIGIDTGLKEVLLDKYEASQ
jgi:hypothetical protein